MDEKKIDEIHIERILGADYDNLLEMDYDQLLFLVHECNSLLKTLSETIILKYKKIEPEILYLKKLKTLLEKVKTKRSVYRDYLSISDDNLIDDNTSEILEYIDFVRKKKGGDEKENRGNLTGDIMREMQNGDDAENNIIGSRGRPTAQNAQRENSAHSAHPRKTRSRSEERTVSFQFGHPNIPNIPNISDIPRNQNNIPNNIPNNVNYLNRTQKAPLRPCSILKKQKK